MGWIWTMLPKERELDLVMFGEEGREMSRMSLRFLLEGWGVGEPLLENEDQGVKVGGDSHRSHTSLIHVPKRGPCQGSKKKSPEYKELWGTSLNVWTESKLRRMYLWGRWQWGHPWGGDVYHAGVTMGLGRDQGTHELKWTPTAKRWLQSSWGL